MKKEEKLDALKKVLYYVEVFGFENCPGRGLCAIFDRLLYSSIITKEQYYFLERILKRKAKLMEMKVNDQYMWKPGIKAPRIKWLKEQIKQLKNN